MKIPGAKLKAGKVMAMHKPPMVATKVRPHNEFEFLSQFKVVGIITF